MIVGLDRHQIDRALAIQSRAYALLCWMESAFERGLIAVERKGACAGQMQSVRGWIEKRVQQVPPDARPPEGELDAFSQFFKTFLTSTFDLDPDPGTRLYSEDAHCFCPCCSWVVKRPHLRPRKVSKKDKRDALRRVGAFVKQTATDANREISDSEVAAILGNQELQLDASLCTYTLEVQNRMFGISRGTETLALWRLCAWEKTGSPKKGFRLTTEEVLAANARVIRAIDA